MVIAEPGQAPLIHVIDDDGGVRQGLADLLRSVGYEVALHGSGAEFLDATLPDRPGCIVLDVRLPGTSGLDLQDQIRGSAVRLPVVLMTGFGDVPMSVRGMKAGAVDFLTKPFREQDMLDAVGAAVALDAARRERQAGLVALRTAAATLTTREGEVLGHVMAGLLNKQIAGRLGLSEVTVKVHRAAVMRKMGARTVADLVRMVERLHGSEPA